DSLLINISNKKNIGWISGLGTGIGYLGTILSVILAYIIGYFYGFESILGIKIIFILTAVLFFGFSLFTFIFVKEISRIKIKKHHFKDAFKRVIFTLKNIRKFKSVWFFLLASFLYTDGANTAIIFLFLYAKDQIGLTLVQFLPVYIIIALAAGLGSISSGKLADKIGHKRTLSIVLFSWIIIIFILYLKTSYATFLLAGILGGALLGATWTTTRPMLVSIAPKGKVAELFGYQGLTEKFSGVIGPLLYGFTAVAIGFRQALLVVIVLFILGAIVLTFVKTKELPKKYQ
ncbi:MFS transporter, partial [Candidatus Woesearchaeota archaeon]|nr:MFS transporter [Candidatus Woesearchaeota archaeon]